MKSKLIFFFIVLCFLNPIIGFTQGMLKNFEMSLGFSTQKQDRRLFDWPGRDEILQMEKSRFDYQFDLLLNKNILVKNRYSFSCGLGYSLHMSKFSRPFNHVYFTGESTEELRHIENYLIHNLRLNTIFKYNLINNEKSKFILILPIGFNFALNKHIKGTVGGWKENKWKLEFNNLDIYSGVGYEGGKLAYYISYRLLDFQRIDRVIFYSLYHVSDPVFINKYDLNKLTNIKVNIGYQF